MNKNTLIRFYRGEATEPEISGILEWINRSPFNKEYFARQKAIYTASLIEACSIRTGTNNTEASSPFAQKFPMGIRRGKAPFLKIASVAAVALLFFTAGYFLNNLKEPSGNSGIYIASAPEPTEPLMRTLYTEKGVKGFLILPDSSKVWLNSDSRITYPERFTGAKRMVNLSGEAYFEVKKDSLMPMLVKTNKDFSVEVLGTTFNIKCYDNDDNGEATLYTGAITMHYKDTKTNREETIRLKPNESFSYKVANSIPKQFNYKKPEIQKAWKDGDLIFTDTPMTEVIKTLERWHGTQFIINNQNIYKYKLSAEFSSESIIQIMEIMQIIMPLKYSCTNNVVTLE